MKELVLALAAAMVGFARLALPQHEVIEFEFAWPTPATARAEFPERPARCGVLE